MNIFTRAILSLAIVACSCNTSFAAGKIKAYFNTPVNTGASTGANAVYLTGDAFADTIVAYINRAKYTLDIAQYDYTYSTGFADIAAAANAAYTRGVVVRWIYDGSSPNSGLGSSHLNAAIPKLASPTTSAYGIMHNKFIIIDANSTDPNDAVVSTGSEDWSSAMMFHDPNNILFFQDSAFAHAYTDEFNMMWGSTTATPNASVAKFGPDKTDLGRHTFTIDGTVVNLYFSPSDHVNSKIITSIQSANTDLYFGVYCFTENANSSDIVNKKNAGIYVAGILDQYSDPTKPNAASGGEYSNLLSGLGSANLKEFVSSSYYYHNKYMIVDPSDCSSDPQVLTGSHNWTTSADQYNDENTVIIHNDTIANQYLQAFVGDFESLGGSISLISKPGCPAPLGVNTVAPVTIAPDVYPNPTNGDVNIGYQLSAEQNVTIGIFNMVGQQITSLAENKVQEEGSHTYKYSINTPGIYFIQFSIANERFTKKIIVTK